MKTIGKGYVHIYTGNGKGKTSAALGLALRAAGRGLKTHMVQFMKGRHYGELEGVKTTGGLITIEQFGHPTFCKFIETPDPKEVKRACSALARIHELMQAHACVILIADEIITACMFKLLTEDDILDVIRVKPEGMELVLTGRGATERMIEAADLVTEMKEIKHYYIKGVEAREGIES
jgi:cob(I)alamin adenosyltransferase